MELVAAQEQFKLIVNNLKPRDKLTFLRWIRSAYCSDELIDQFSSNADVMLQHIQEDLRESLPTNALSPTENIITPTIGQNADCHPTTTVHIDGFLYPDDLVDQLCDEGKMSRNYCKQCGSHQVAPLRFLSHSTSLNQLKFIFQYALPELSGKRVLDVGSRLGAVLYGAYYYSGASYILGVEMNEHFCQLQQQIVDKYQLQDRVQIIHANICTQEELLKSADVVIMQNVFEFFAAIDIQERIWVFLHKALRKKGTLLVTSPSLEESLEYLQTKINICDWVKQIPLKDSMATANLHLYGDPVSQDSDLHDIYLYQVL